MTTAATIPSASLSFPQTAIEEIWYQRIVKQQKGCITGNDLKEVLDAIRPDDLSGLQWALGGVVEVDFSGKEKATDPILKLLSETCPRLRKLDLTGCVAITEQGLRSLNGLPLEYLDLRGIQAVTDQTLQALVDLPHLQQLELSGCPITDAGLQHIGERWPQLRRLNLAHTKISDRGVAFLHTITSLTDLALAGCKITDVAIQRLVEHHSLTGLYLGGTRLTDRALESLKDQPLKYLALGSPQFSDRGFPHLEKLPLIELILDRCQISDKAFSYLAHPPLEILSLIDCDRVTDLALEHLKKLPKLKLKVRGDTQIATEALRVFQRTRR